MYWENLALNNLQWWICHKTKLNQTFFPFFFIIGFFSTVYKDVKTSWACYWRLQWDASTSKSKLSHQETDLSKLYEALWKTEWAARTCWYLFLDFKEIFFIFKSFKVDSYKQIFLNIASVFCLLNLNINVCDQIGPMKRWSSYKICLEKSRLNWKYSIWS